MASLWTPCLRQMSPPDTFKSSEGRSMCYEECRASVEAHGTLQRLCEGSRSPGQKVNTRVRAPNHCLPPFSLAGFALSRLAEPQQRTQRSPAYFFQSHTSATSDLRSPRHHNTRPGRAYNATWPIRETRPRRRRRQPGSQHSGRLTPNKLRPFVPRPRARGKMLHTSAQDLHLAVNFR